MLDWHSCQICYPFEIKILLLSLLLLSSFQGKKQNRWTIKYRSLTYIYSMWSISESH